MMKIKSVDIKSSIDKVKKLLKQEKGVPGPLRAAVEMLILLITVLTNRLNLNSSNSSKPPSMDPNRNRKSKEGSNRKPGGQNGHKGVRLTKFETPDKVKFIKVDRKRLPLGEYEEVGYESRQVVDIRIKRVVTEYRGQILKNSKGKKYIAEFPKGVETDIQYGVSVKTNSVYMSQFQLVPYNRIQDHFSEQMDIPISPGTIFNFNMEAYNLLETFEEIAKKKLKEAYVVHADETGINIGGKRRWLHLASNKLWTYFFPHEKRGSDAMNDIGILPNFSGILCHDHWNPYYNYGCSHALCNAHHLRELERAIEEDRHKWAIQMKNFLIGTNKEVEKAGGNLSEKRLRRLRKKYSFILKNAAEECPNPIRVPGQKGRLKKSKSRNLIDRLIGRENDVLRFMEDSNVPFTNNLAENDLRMTKVQQKISGCFRSTDGAHIFCRIRGYLSTCRKHGVKASDALKILFEGKLPHFVDDS